MSSGVEEGTEYSAMSQLVLEENDIGELLNSMVEDRDEENGGKKQTATLASTDVDRIMQKVKYCKGRDGP